MANAVVGDYGDDITISTGQDLTTAEEFKVFVTKPDGTVLTKTSANGVVVAGTIMINGVSTVVTAADGYIIYEIENGVLDIDGTYLFSGYFEIDGDGVFSQATPNEYEVKRRNQTP